MRYDLDLNRRIHHAETGPAASGPTALMRFTMKSSASSQLTRGLALEQDEVDIVTDLENAVARADTASVMKPIMVPTESGCPAIHKAITLPISARGILPMTMRDSTADLYRL
jgi:hypothetical protein